MTGRLIIIGCVAAGAKAAAKARRIDPRLEIIIYQDESEVSYSACGQPYVLSGVIDQREKIIIRRPQDFAQDDIKILVRHRVESLDIAARRLTVANLDTGNDSSITYDRLIIATGARPIIPPMAGLPLEGVVSLRSITDLDRFSHCLETLKPKTAAVIGAGYIGLELAETFHTLGIQTTIVEKANRILPKFDPEMAQQVHNHLSEKGIGLILGDCPLKLHGKDGRVTSLETESSRALACDLVVMAIGVKPNVDLARRSGIALGVTGAIAVDTRMETKIKGIYAAGDCCETVDRVTGDAIWLPLGDIANLQGRVAGENAAGGDARFPGVFGTAIFKTFDMNIAITGLSSIAADQAGLKPVSVRTTGKDRARYYPGGRAVDIKLVANGDTGRLLGAQVIGPGAADKMIDIAATALLGKLTCDDLENADLAYSPPFSPVLSPMIMAAGALNNKLKENRKRPCTNIESSAGVFCS